MTARRGVAAVALVEALYEEGLTWGVHNRPDERLAVARSVLTGGVENSGTSVLKVRFIEAAFRLHGLPRPPRGYATAVIARVKRLAKP